MILTGSYVPTNGGACEVGGRAYSYFLNLLCGSGAVRDEQNPTDPQEQRVQVGYGLPARPSVSVGALAGQDANDCENMVVVITSDNEAFTDCPASAPSSGVRVRSWRDR